eukprot:362070-Chlamydomonas_euryale.AAC.26
MQVVSRDGTLLSKAGLITGGSSASSDARAQRWDDGAITKLKEKVGAARLDACLQELVARMFSERAREELEGQLRAHGRGGAAQERAAQLVSELPSLEARLQYARAESQSAAARASSLAAGAAQLDREAAGRQAAIDALVAAVEQRTEEVRRPAGA